MPGYRPLTRAHVFSAAVIGSMVPDFGLLLPRYPARVETHSLLALITFCLPVGLATYWLTQLLIKPAVIEVLPDGAYARLKAAHPAAALSSIHTWFTVTAALLFGALTHLIWDAFTHENARGVRTFPMLGSFDLEFEGHPLVLYLWLQFISSVVGLLVVVAALIVWLRNAQTPATPSVRLICARERAVWIFVFLLPPVMFVSRVVRTLWTWRLLGLHIWTAWAAGSVAIASIRGAAVSLLLVSALLRIRLAII